MSREIKFRAWGKNSHKYLRDIDDRKGFSIKELGYIEHLEEWELMQYTGLKDKNGDKEVYEGDIIDTEGNIIGNQYETPTLLERKSNMLVQGFGTKAWLTTYQEAVDRGCHDA